MTIDSDSNTRRTFYLWIETGVVLIACVIPYLVTSAADVYGLRGPSALMSFEYRALTSLVDYAGKISLILFIIWRSKDLPARFGLKPYHMGRDLIGAIATCAILLGVNYLFWWTLRAVLSRHDYLAILHSGTPSAYGSASGSPEFLLLALICLASGFAQELLMRAYLIVRFEELTRSTAVTLLMSTALFTCYHGYQGTSGMISAALFGLLLGAIFCRTRRLTPIALAHSMYNFIAISGAIKFF
jgi:membrane protease YdiL (CAAX protease family)